jgi:hypothetical protein
MAHVIVQDRIKNFGEARYAQARKFRFQTSKKVGATLCVAGIKPFTRAISANDPFKNPDQLLGTANASHQDLEKMCVFRCGAPPFRVTPIWYVRIR